MKDKCTPIFTAALFAIVKTWTQPKRPSTEEGIRKMRYTHTMECYSAMKRNEIGSFVVMWTDLEFVIHSKVDQEGKNKCCILKHPHGI